MSKDEMSEEPNWTLEHYKVHVHENLSILRWEDAAPIEQFPHVVNRLIGMWGFPEFLPYLDSLLVNKTRVSRKGFPIDANDDLVFLYFLYTDQFSSVCRDASCATVANKGDTWGIKPI